MRFFADCEEQLLSEFGIPLSTLSTVLKNKQNVLDAYQQSFSSQQKRVRGSKFPDVEAALMVWLRNARAANLPVTTALMVEKADPMALQMGHTDFNCSSGWFDCFKKRNSVVSKSVHSKSGTADAATGDNWHSSRLAELQKSCADRDIFNLHEAVLFYKMFSSSHLHTEGWSMLTRETMEGQGNGPFRHKCHMRRKAAVTDKWHSSQV
ncbi:hypothetical protein HPB50_007283 [Hyalomma asiaticum]|uniref:Uncharacterized protein n=1 Tax=Hyalomma asiaticum TaxID=266040 RepID=A0ACB7RYD5_HYAAI|nr:hypothetical protein HPB50_007283 [Hyalomma asiaticum]